MSNPKPFEVTADTDPDEPGLFKLRAGRGCLALSISWVIATLALAVAILVRACS